jgi:predicted polyphosphate/ATP-dependent NAD kinase
MAHMDVGCIVTLGGDGTNRAVVAGSRSVPLVPISTGTNNVFPRMLEGTVAGLAAGVVARRLINLASVVTVPPVLEVRFESQFEVALIDVAVSSERFVGARAVWDLDTVEELFLARSEPGSIGLSAIGAHLDGASGRQPSAHHIRLGEGRRTVLAPVAPGTVTRVRIQGSKRLELGQAVALAFDEPRTLALDGERSFVLKPRQRAEVKLSDKGPPVVDVEATLRAAAKAGVFVRNS